MMDSGEGVVPTIDNRVQMEARGKELVRGINEAVFEGWNGVRKGAGVFFGSTYDGSTGRSSGSSESHLMVAVDGVDEPVFGRDFPGLREVVDGLSQEMKPLMAGLRQRAEIKGWTGGPAEVFDDEISSLYEKMMKAENVAEAKEAGEEMLTRIREEEAKIIGEADGVEASSAEMVGVTGEKASVYGEEMKKVEYSGTVHTFDQSLRALEEQVGRDKNSSDPICEGVKMSVRGIGDQWSDFLGQCFGNVAN